MLLLLLGFTLWVAAHLFKRVLPEKRAAMGDAKAKGLVTFTIFLAIALMVFGYRMADGAFFWGRHPATVGINNLLMVIALYFTSQGPKKGALFYKMRHPMLTGFAIWAAGHLLVNGDVPSFVLFGGFLIWSLATMIIINRSEPEWSPPAKGSLGKDAMFFVISLGLVAVIGYIHGLLGPVAFG